MGMVGLMSLSATMLLASCGGENPTEEDAVDSDNEKVIENTVMKTEPTVVEKTVMQTVPREEQTVIEKETDQEVEPVDEGTQE
jgi:hypothetical protein